VSLPIYMDHHIHAAITAGLRRRGIDCITAAEDGAAQTPDVDLLQRATDLGRPLFSQDVDLLAITADWLKSGRPFAGLI